MKFKKLYLIICSLFFLSCNSQNSKSIVPLDVKSFSEKINVTKKPQLLDVRTPEEFAGNHLDNAINENWNDPNFNSNIDKYDRKQPIFVYCLSGGRSKKAAEKLAELGFSQVYEMQGGIVKWNAAGLSKPSNKVSGMTMQEYQKLLNSDKQVLINFNAVWCAPCKVMQPYILKMQKDLSNKVTIIRLDADENKTLLTALKIDALPALILYKNKQVLWQHSGFMSESALQKKLE